MNLLMPLRRALRFAALRPEAKRFAARAFVLAPVVEASLSLAGLSRTLHIIDAVPAREAKGAVGVAEGHALIEAVYRSHFVRGACLPQSLLQYLLHRRDGVDVKLVFGVRPDRRKARATIAAHAWVEPADSPAKSARGSHLPDLVTMPEGLRA